MQENPAYIEKLQSYADTLHDFYMRALKLNPFELLCSILRVDGPEDMDWDFYEDSQVAFEGFQGSDKVAREGQTENQSYQGKLTLYSHMVEMAAPHEMLANILRAVSHKDYLVKPFGCLGRPTSGPAFSWIGLSTRDKFDELKRQAVEVGEVKLSECIDRFFDETLRGAISNSDYELTEEFFKWAENGIPQQRSLESVDEIVLNGFAFYNAFLANHKHFKMMFREMCRFHKWPNYQVFEVLSEEETGLFGFNIHFANGSKSTFIRNQEGTDTQNIFHSPDGSIQFSSGFIDALEKKWKINGEEVCDWKEFSNAN